LLVIPGRTEGASPESILPVVVMDSGFAAARRPGMTSGVSQRSAAQLAGCGDTLPEFLSLQEGKWSAGRRQGAALRRPLAEPCDRPAAHPRRVPVARGRRLRGARAQWRRALRLPGLHRGAHCRRAALCSAYWNAS